MHKYRRVTHEDRCHIYALLKTGMPKEAIAWDLGFHKSTIFREFKRNSDEYGYLPRLAQAKASKNFLRCRRRPVISGAMEGQVIELLLRDFSPEYVSGRLNLEGHKAPSIQSIYTFLRTKERRLLPVLRRWNKRGGGRIIQRRSRHKDRIYIDERPEVANQRARLGDWERDTFYAKDGAAFLVCVDRRSKFLRLSRVPSLRSNDIATATQGLLAGLTVHTITNDNGSEFRRTEHLDCPVYFCHPHKPQQRGTVENTIGLLRQYIKRGTDVKNLSAEDIQDIEDLLNHRPRKVLGFKTPYEVHFNKIVALAS